MKYLGIFTLLALVSTSTGQWQFWTINDINYDPTYNTTGESCIGDVTGRDPRGHYDCDAPWEMVVGAIRKMSYTFGTPEFIIWGGANSFHINTTSTVFSEELLLEIMTNITNLFRQEFPGIQVVPVLGDRDWYPQSQLPADGDTSNNDLYDKYHELWSDWIPDEYENTFKKAGYYTVSLSRDRITAIVLNSALYLPENNAVTGSDPGGQFQWLREELNTVRQDRKKVHIFTHAPVGSLKTEYNTQLIDIIREFSDVIIAIYGGYEKTDQFKLIYDTDGRPVACVLLAPSLSPRKGTDGYARNPAFRGYIFDMYGGLVDTEQFHLNMADNKPWGSLYKYSYFRMRDVNVTNLHKFMQNMEVYGSQYFHDYHKYKHVDIGWPYYTPCSCKCKHNEICAINNIEQEDYQRCVERAFMTCGAGQKYYSIFLMFALIVISKIINS